MALTRNQRRLNAKKRHNLREADKANTQRELAKQELIQANHAELGRKANRLGGLFVSRGLVTDYSPARNPLSYTRPMRFSHGVAD